MYPLIRLFSLTAIFALLSITTVYAQNCEPDYPPSTPNERFEEPGDGTVKDKQTGLIWKRCLQGLSGTDCSQGDALALNWEQALQQAEANLGWRVPNIKELQSIVEQQCFDPALNLQIFPGNTDTSNVWSSTPSVSNVYGQDAAAWHLWFKVGRTEMHNRESVFHVRLVRSGQSLPGAGLIAHFNFDDGFINSVTSSDDAAKWVGSDSVVVQNSALMLQNNYDGDPKRNVTYTIPLCQDSFRLI